jgi:hypothetical protein
LLVGAVAALVLVVAGGIWMGPATAQDATPAAGIDRTTLVLIEHSDNATDVDVDANGPSVGDLRVWGPNPLYDERDAADTGAVTQGACIAINADWDCVLTETILFPDGSTLELQGVEHGSATSTRTIVGGSGRYLGATGVMTVEPTDDLSLWRKTIVFGER